MYTKVKRTLRKEEDVYRQVHAFYKRRLHKVESKKRKLEENSGSVYALRNLHSLLSETTAVFALYSVRVITCRPLCMRLYICCAYDFPYAFCLVSDSSSLRNSPFTVNPACQIIIACRHICVSTPSWTLVNFKHFPRTICHANAIGNLFLHCFLILSSFWLQLRSLIYPRENFSSETTAFMILYPQHTLFVEPPLRNGCVATDIKKALSSLFSLILFSLRV